MGKKNNILENGDQNSSCLECQCQVLGMFSDFLTFPYRRGRNIFHIDIQPQVREVCITSME